MNEENVNERKKYTVLLIIGTTIGTAMIIIGSYFWLLKKDDKPVDNNGNNQQQNNTETKYENELTSDETGTYGTVYLEGYAKVKKEADCGVDVCQGNEPVYDVVSFYVTSPKVEGIDDWFVKDQNGENAYIQLGCLENGIVSFTAFADEFYKKRSDNIHSSENYFKTIEFSKSDSSKIISSNENNRITLKIENKKWSYGGDGFTCSSRITGAEVVK